jgi:3-hydroxybutyryl-CoA dehydrogenase
MVDDWQVVVVGAGTMGAGIAQVYALNGFKTTLVDLDAESLARAEKAIAISTALLVKEQLATANDAEQAKRLITFETTDRLDQILPTADLVVEAFSKIRR